MPELLLNRVRDRPPTPAEVKRDIQRLGYTKGGALAGWAHFDKATGQLYYLCVVVAFCDQDDLYAQNFMSGKQSELEWHQRDHVVTGFAFSTVEPETHWDALASAQRGELERAGLCVWLNRGEWPKFLPRYCWYRRAPRIYPTFRPAGPELSFSEIRNILAH